MVIQCFTRDSIRMATSPRFLPSLHRSPAPWSQNKMNQWSWDDPPHLGLKLYNKQTSALQAVLFHNLQPKKNRETPFCKQSLLLTFFGCIPNPKLPNQDAKCFACFFCHQIWVSIHLFGLVLIIVKNASWSMIALDPKGGYPSWNAKQGLAIFDFQEWPKCCSWIATLTQFEQLAVPVAKLVMWMPWVAHKSAKVKVPITFTRMVSWTSWWCSRWGEENGDPDACLKKCINESTLWQQHANMQHLYTKIPSPKCRHTLRLTTTSLLTVRLTPVHIWTTSKSRCVHHMCAATVKKLSFHRLTVLESGAGPPRGGGQRETSHCCFETPNWMILNSKKLPWKALLSQQIANHSTNPTSPQQTRMIWRFPFLPHLYLEPSQSVPLLFATCHHPDKWKHLSKISHNIQSRAKGCSHNTPRNQAPKYTILRYLSRSQHPTRDCPSDPWDPNLPNTRNFTFLAFGRYGNTMRFQRRFILVPAKEMRYVALTQLDNQNKNANRFHANHCQFIAE